MKQTLFCLGSSLLILLSGSAFAQESEPPPRSSLLEDRAARGLLEAGDARLAAGERAKAVEVWESVIERYPRSNVRFEAHFRLGTHRLERERAFDRARTHFAVVAGEENPNQDQRALAKLNIGVCYYEARNFGKCFTIMREVIEEFPVSTQVNQAYYYIGLGHFQLAHYSRAIAALEKVGTAFAKDDKTIEKVEAGKRLFVRIEDADLAALEVDEKVPVRCQTEGGDTEAVECIPVGRNVRVVLGSIPTRLGKPVPGNGILEIRGGDRVKVIYMDKHTSEGKIDQERVQTLGVVGDAVVGITDGAFQETLGGAVLGRNINLQIIDADFDRTDNADVVKAVVEVYREKTAEELEASATNEELGGAPPGEKVEGEEKPAVDRYKRLDRVEVVLKEAKVVRNLRSLSGDENESAGEQPSEEPREDPTDTSIHSGVFRGMVPIVNTAEVNDKDDVLQALPGHFIRVTYADDFNTTGSPRTLTMQVRCVEGNLGGVRVTRASISDQELRVKTNLKTASALTNIGDRYKEFGLVNSANAKYQQALDICEEISADAQKLGGRTLEETYVQLWKIYFAMDRLNLASAMSQRLQKEFPNSEFVDEALLQLGHVSRTKGDFRRAISIYNSLINIKTSDLRGEAQYHVGVCYEELAKTATEAASIPLFERSFQEYKKVFDLYPESGRVGEAVAKMANFYYQKKDYARAVDVFENVLSSHPDAKFLDVILFNYGRCLFRMERKADARKRFDQLIQDFPESPLATDAKKISEALIKAGF